MKIGKTLRNELEVGGMKMDWGYISPHFIINPKNKKCMSFSFLKIILPYSISFHLIYEQNY